MKVLAIVGSMSISSTTRAALAVALKAVAEAGADVEWLDLREMDLPICDGRDDECSYGDRVVHLKERVSGADAFLVGSPEYYGSMSGALKNAIDLIGPEPMKGKMAGLLAVARGDAGAMNTLNHLRHVFRWVGAWVLPTQVSVPRAQDAFDQAGIPVRDGLEEELYTLGTELVRYSRLLAGGRKV